MEQPKKKQKKGKGKQPVADLLTALSPLLLTTRTPGLEAWHSFSLHLIRDPPPRTPLKKIHLTEGPLRDLGRTKEKVCKAKGSGKQKVSHQRCPRLFFCVFLSVAACFMFFV